MPWRDREDDEIEIGKRAAQSKQIENDKRIPKGDRKRYVNIKGERANPRSKWGRKDSY